MGVTTGRIGDRVVRSVVTLLLLLECLVPVHSFLPYSKPTFGFESSSSSSSSSFGWKPRPQQGFAPHTATQESSSSSSSSSSASYVGGSDLTLGSPQGMPPDRRRTTTGGIVVESTTVAVPYGSEGSDARLEELVDRLDVHRGVLLGSSYEYPGRYRRWSMGFWDPPLEIVGGNVNDRTCTVRALNDRGRVLLPPIEEALRKVTVSKDNKKIDKDNAVLSSCIPIEDGDALMMTIVPTGEVGSFTEEDRSKQPSVFSVVRILVDLFGLPTNNDDAGPADPQLGLYGAFGYDLTFQWEPPTVLHQDRDADQRDLLLYLPDRILVVDDDRREAWTTHYEYEVFSGDGQGTVASTRDLPRTGAVRPLCYDSDDSDDSDDGDMLNGEDSDRDTPEGEYARSVERSREQFRVGNLFEVVLSQTFRRRLTSTKTQSPSAIYRRLRRRNPSPYGFLINLGEDEFLVGASPEMFVRVEDVTYEGSDSEGGTTTTSSGERKKRRQRVETCPISGTIARGRDALEDAVAIASLLQNRKEESELTMCTDVDRNDKARVCVPGTVKVIGRRQIEMYSRLIHTVDHVEGVLSERMDALDAFLVHAWAVTVTGAPKTWAIRFIEEQERSPRRWYGGAVGLVGFDGGLNTGLTLRTVRVHRGVAEVRAGATLLWDSDPRAEEAETELKASAILDAVVRGDDDDSNHVEDSTDAEDSSNGATAQTSSQGSGTGRTVVLVDHEDSFVHTLGDYLRQTGAEVTTLRSGPAVLETLAKNPPDLVVLSPGPGNPSDFETLGPTLDYCAEHRLPCFGVCLGLQAMVEYFGGRLDVLGYPMHGKASTVQRFCDNDNNDDDPKDSSNSSTTTVLEGLPPTFEVARYHSLYGVDLPPELKVLAMTQEDEQHHQPSIVMAIQHATLPFAAVQFHPESILTSPRHGLQILNNAFSVLSSARPEDTTATTHTAPTDDGVPVM